MDFTKVQRKEKASQVLFGKKPANAEDDYIFYETDITVCISINVNAEYVYKCRLLDELKHSRQFSVNL